MPVLCNDVLYMHVSLNSRWTLCRPIRGQTATSVPAQPTRLRHHRRRKCVQVGRQASRQVGIHRLLLRSHGYACKRVSTGTRNFTNGNNNRLFYTDESMHRKKSKKMEKYKKIDEGVAVSSHVHTTRNPARHSAKL